MHKRKRAIIFSRFSRNIHNIMAMAIQYTSNGLSTYLVVHQLIFFTAFQLHLYRLLFITRLFRPIHHFNTMETSSTHAQLLSYPDLPQSSRAVPVIATVLASVAHLGGGGPQGAKAPPSDPRMNIIKIIK